MVRKGSKRSNNDNNNESLSEHHLVGKIVKDPSKPGNAILLQGYVGKSDSPDLVRLYLDLNFDNYVDIPKNEILHSADAPEGVLEFGGTYIWVSKDTEISYVQVRTTKKQAKFLEVDILLQKPVCSYKNICIPGFNIP